MKKLWFLFGCIFSVLLLAWCCTCPCSENTGAIDESINKSEFVVTDFDSAMTAFYNWWNFTCNFSWDIDGTFGEGYVAVDWNRMSAHVNWEDDDSKGEGHLIIKNWLYFEWTKEDGVIEWEIDEGWVEDILDFLYELRDSMEESMDWTWVALVMDCKAWIEESHFIVPDGIDFDY